MPTVALTVDCRAAHTGRCYTREIVKLAEDAMAPLTWLIQVSLKDPMSNIDLYHNDYFHRIPAWHEMGLGVAFEGSEGRLTDPGVRGDAIRAGKDVLKSRHIKPTSFRAVDQDLLASDLHSLEDIGILIDASTCAVGPDCAPYHPSYDDPSVPGSAHLLVAPVAALDGTCGLLAQGWDKVQPVVERCLAGEAPAVLSLPDNVNCMDALRHTLALCRERGAGFVTLTQLAALLSK